LKNLPVPSKNNLQHYTNAELLEQNKSLFEKDYYNLIIILDVLNTGKTLLKLIEELKQMLKLTDKCKINCISIISNVNQRKDKGLIELNSIGTFCGELQQPVVPKDFLPPESILERKEYFKD
jgi:adenine/guanine phosphoribosyltransferase-like PRPP-binding protein